MNNDLIKRNIAIAYATSGLIRRIDGEEWIRISEVKQSLQDVPTVEERKQGEWIDIDSLVSKAICSKCQKPTITEPFGKPNYCPNCGADMRGEEP